MSSKEVHAILDIIKRCCTEISELIRGGDSDNNSKEMHLTNATGDEQLKLDLVSNSILLENLSECKHIKTIGSEELETFIETGNEYGEYLVCFDPLDGSSNINVNITVGTIFAIYKYSNGTLGSGRNIVMAGYCLYGGSTQLIVSDVFSNATNMYTLRGSGHFVLTEPNIRIPDKGKIYAINESNRYRYLDKRLNAFVEWLIRENRTARWVGSLVADAHRTLMKGGFFAYPGNIDHPCGKLRLLYEVYPFAFIFEMSGGKTSDGISSSLLDLTFPVDDIHQKTSCYLSSVYEMDLLDKIIVQ